ncbi:hypothetical protein [Corynebacterium ulcerans]
MFSAIYDFLANLFDFDFLSSNPKGYFAEGWGDFKEIFASIKNAISS